MDVPLVSDPPCHWMNRCNKTMVCCVIYIMYDAVLVLAYVGNVVIILRAGEILENMDFFVFIKTADFGLHLYWDITREKTAISYQ